MFRLSSSLAGGGEKKKKKNWKKNWKKERKRKIERTKRKKKEGGLTELGFLLLLVDAPPKDDQKDVDHVPEHEKQRLPQLDRGVSDKDPDGGNSDGVEAHIAQKGPPGHLEGCEQGNGAHYYCVHKDPSSKNGSKGELGRLLRNSGKGTEEVWRAIAQGKERDSSYVLRELGGKNEEEEGILEEEESEEEKKERKKREGEWRTPRESEIRDKARQK